MNPLDIFVNSSLRLTPSLIEYEVGSEVEIIVYNYLKRVKDHYNDVYIVSFLDAHISFINYLKRVIGEDKTNDVLKDCKIIPVLSKRDKIKGGDTNSAPIIAGKLGDFFRKAEGKILSVVMGLDFYSILFSEKSLVGLYPRIATLTNYNKNLDVTIILNIKIFPDYINQIVDSFSHNIARLGVEKNEKDVRRYFMIVRSIFLEYNLRKWYYEIIGEEIRFYQ